MENRQIAEELVKYCRQGQWVEAHTALYAPDAISIEPGEGGSAQGLEKLKEKSDWFEENFETHGIEVSDPIYAGDMFAISIKLDCSSKKNGEKAPMEEICIYEIQNGKIVKEQFF